MSESIHSAQAADLAEFAQQETARIRKERGMDPGGTEEEDSDESEDEDALASGGPMTELHGDAPTASGASQPESVGKAEGSDAFTPYASKKTKK